MIKLLTTLPSPNCFNLEKIYIIFENIRILIFWNLHTYENYVTTKNEYKYVIN